MNEIKRQHGAFSWNELMTPDTDAAKSFYGELFGWTIEDMDCGGETYSVIKLGEQELGGIMKTPAEAAGMPPMWGSYVTVDDIHRSVEQVQALGGSVIVPPREIPETGTFCVIQDPQGATLNLFQFTDA